jgi:hypothetical protein
MLCRPRVQEADVGALFLLAALAFVLPIGLLLAALLLRTLPASCAARTSSTARWCGRSA